MSGVSLYKLFKRLKGRRIEKPEDVPKDLALNISVELLIKIYNDPEVQAQLRQTLIAKAAWGFANSTGGVIVIGVEASGGRPETPDVVRELKPVSDMGAVASADLDAILK